MNRRIAGAAVATLFLLIGGCTRPVVPGHVRARVAYGEHDPSGTWTRADGSGATLELTRPEGNFQLFGVQYSDAQGTRLAGEALVDGDAVYLTFHNGQHANDLCIYLYTRRPDGTLEALWGSARGIAPIAYEEAHPAGEVSGWDGAYAEWGNNRGGVYRDRLIIGRSLDGREGVHRLHWTQGNGGWYRGAAFEHEERMIGVRLPGVLVHQSTQDWGSVRVTTRSSEVGRDVVYVVGAYRLEGDVMVGRELSNAIAGGPSPGQWTRAGAVTPTVPSAAPEPPPEVAEPPVTEPEVESPIDLAVSTESTEGEGSDASVEDPAAAPEAPVSQESPAEVTDAPPAE